MKLIIGMCAYNKEQENIAKNLKPNILLDKKDFKSDIDIFNHLFEETNKLCTEWDDVVVLINNCTLTAETISEIRTFFTKYTNFNILDVVPNNISKKLELTDYTTIHNETLKMSNNIYNRFDIKCFRHFVHRMVGGINKEFVEENEMQDFIFTVFNEMLTKLDKVAINQYMSSEKINKKVVTGNKKVSQFTKMFEMDRQKMLNMFRWLDL